MGGNRKTAPWYRRVRRWGQTNLNELDPTRYDRDWWREYWRATRVQGIIVNAGGIVSYYPSRYPEVHRAQFLGDRDLFGEITADAHEEGLAVLARMDANRVYEKFYLEHPDWCAIDAQGNPYRAGELYVTCINSPYYHEFLPDIFREIIARSRPEGFTDNSYSGLERHHICYCHHCAKGFRDETGFALPKAVDWDDEAYRQWIQWSYRRRLAVWDLNNRVTQEAGGKDCLWVGMIHGDIINQSVRLRDVKAILKRTEIVMLDWQTRRSSVGFQHNGETGKLLHGVLGWDKLIPESMAMYQAGEPTARVGSKPEPEARLWAFEGFAGGIQPWWHHIGAYQEDRRQYRTTQPIFQWHEKNEKYLFDREPIATVGIAWGQRNIDYYGRDDAYFKTELPWRGWTQAMIRARIPYLPVHIDDLDEARKWCKVLILPNFGALSDEQCEKIRSFVQNGGALIASGETSLYDEWGDCRGDFALADLFDVHATGASLGRSDTRRQNWEKGSDHSYLRLKPELRGRVWGPKIGNEPPITGERHPVLNGFDETDIIHHGGRLQVVKAGEFAETLATYVPPFPVYPPETAWMRYPDTSHPALVIREGGVSRDQGEKKQAGPVAYLAADLDRRYGLSNFPDHGAVLSNLVRWMARGDLPLEVKGSGFIDCHLFHQEGRLVLHTINLNQAESWRPTVHELVPVGPFEVRVRLPNDVKPERVLFTVGEGVGSVSVDDGWCTFEIPRIVDHEVTVIE